MSDYFSRAAAFAQNAAKISKKVSEGLVENARELGFDAMAVGGGANSSGNYFDMSEEKMRNIRSQLDSRYDREKLEGLKRLIAMISRGRDVREFFPNVVKNVASQNIEIRKLVYIYLLRYAEQEPDLALLSINTFQKDLTDQNPLIRAMALRVMSGIRVPVISPIVMLGIKKCVKDLSPYVRKTAAHAIPKLLSLDPSQLEPLIDIISDMLNDNSTFTIGSVIMAFNEVCPERYDLIHPHFRKLCRMLIDCDEWGQIATLDLLLRYSRTQFTDPNINGTTYRGETTKTKNEKSFYSDEDEEDSDDEYADPHLLDPDHELLLRSCASLFQSRNSGVVLSVAKVFYHLAPDSEAQKIAKPLLKLLRSHREMQYVVLANIATIATERPHLFEPHHQHFYVRSTDPPFIYRLKLEILTLIATETNINTLLRELQAYVKSPSKDFVTVTIQAIGRCAMRVPKMADTCLHGLMKLLWSKNDAVVAESVVVIKRLLQMGGAETAGTITQLARAFDHITVPMARASILWLIGQYGERLPKIGPDVLRKATKNFMNEADVTKLQILTLAAKLVCLESDQPTLRLLFQYVLNLARYDLNYDVRDRARLLRGLMLDSPAAGVEAGVVLRAEKSVLQARWKQILLSEKDAPVVVSPSSGRQRFMLGSLSLVYNQEVPGYRPLPAWATEKTDSSVRNSKNETWGSRPIERGFGSEDFGNVHGQGVYAGRGVEQKVAVKRDNEYDLDAFYEETETEESEEEEETEEEDEEETEESQEEDEEDEDEEDEDEEDEEEEDEDEDEDEDEYEETEESEDEEVAQRSKLIK
ncbi:uncharacterized protein VTP21DRAFT_2128 [Calcarisporiella thermophila]|uniref:uncharacterized protein n=1 Tax=Calcarisporiella thermophila TaxID=911321 RepID=UPI003744A972